MGNEFKDLFGDWEPGESARRGNPMDGEPENRGPRELNEKEVRVVGVYEVPSPGLGNPPQTFVLLQDNRKRKVLIFIGRAEAYAISMAIDGEQADRPMTHDLLKLVVERLGGTVERVVVDDIWQETFYAKLSLTRGGESFEIDCRPSDAMAIALRAKAPIYMAEAVIEQSQHEG